MLILERALLVMPNQLSECLARPISDGMDR